LGVPRGRAIPHVRKMVIAIRHKDQIHALESGRAALAEMNGTRRSVISDGRTEPTAEGTGKATARQQETPNRRRRSLVQTASAGI